MKQMNGQPTKYSCDYCFSDNALSTSLQNQTFPMQSFHLRRRRIVTTSNTTYYNTNQQQPSQQQEQEIQWLTPLRYYVIITFASILTLICLGLVIRILITMYYSPRTTKISNDKIDSELKIEPTKTDEQEDDDDSSTNDEESKKVGTTETVANKTTACTNSIEKPSVPTTNAPISSTEFGKTRFKLFEYIKRVRKMRFRLEHTSNDRTQTEKFSNTSCVRAQNPKPYGGIRNDVKRSSIDSLPCIQEDCENSQAASNDGELNKVCGILDSMISDVTMSRIMMNPPQAQNHENCTDTDPHDNSMNTTLYIEDAATSTTTTNILNLDESTTNNINLDESTLLFQTPNYNNKKQNHASNNKNNKNYDDSFCTVSPFDETIIVRNTSSTKKKNGDSTHINNSNQEIQSSTASYINPPAATTIVPRRISGDESREGSSIVSGSSKSTRMHQHHKGQDDKGATCSTGQDERNQHQPLTLFQMIQANASATKILEADEQK